ncbi:MAG: hypothetical protein WBA23_12340 [Tunicatimonas sp.]|uniref:hypothetical protein n=1 Tax=Tunicatimonas sp. TaxID=1940096 RepID=UPI003C796BD8
MPLNPSGLETSLISFPDYNSIYSLSQMAATPQRTYQHRYPIQKFNLTAKPFLPFASPPLALFPRFALPTFSSLFYRSLHLPYTRLPK